MDWTSYQLRNRVLFVTCNDSDQLQSFQVTLIFNSVKLILKIIINVTRDLSDII